MQITDTLSLRILADRIPAQATSHQLMALRHLLLERHPRMTLAEIPDHDLLELFAECSGV